MASTDQRTGPRITVIGAGLAGLTCATRAASQGLHVTVLEAGADALYPCNSRMTGGLFHIAMEDLTAPADIALARIADVTEGAGDTDLARALVTHARPALEWLRSQGVGFMKAGPDGLRKFSLAPPRVRRTGVHWRGRGGDTMLRMLTAALERMGGRVLLGHAARSLRMQAGRCTGVVARHGGKDSAFAADAVVICDGGFQANPDMVRRYISAAPERLLMRNAGSGRGQGIEMAQAVGADITGMDAFYGHIHHRDAMQTDSLWPFPVLDSICTAGVMVDGAGRRFTDEGRGAVHGANAIAGLPDPLAAWVIFDDAIWQGPARDWLLPANPWLVAAGGRGVSAGTLADLAQGTGLAADMLAATIAAHNAFIDSGIPQAIPRSTSHYRALPVRHGRFHALPLCAGITHTMGGLRIAASAQVLRADGSAIAGLYAAGSCTGGLEGGPARGYVGGLSKAAVFGLIAADTIVQAA